MAASTRNFDDTLILAVETSGRLGSIAFGKGRQLLDERQFSGPMRHSAEIFPAIMELLGRFDKKPEQIEQVYISAGPGSFTGLRIAVTFAKTLALANSAKIVAVDTLDCIAANVTQWDKYERLGVILDAKRGQFFVAVYEQTPDSRPKTQDIAFKKILPDSLMTAEAFTAQFADRPIAVTGEGLVFYKDMFANENIHVFDERLWNPSAANVYKLGLELAEKDQFADPLTLTPNYVRGPDVTVKQR